MSKIGRKPINLNGVQVNISNNEIQYKGKKAAGTFMLPDVLGAEVDNGSLRLAPARPLLEFSTRERRDLNRVWGLNYALLKNKIFGASQDFEIVLQINGLGYKAVIASPQKLVFSLGKSHKIDFILPAGVTVDVDSKTGQRLTLKSSDNVILGQTASKIKAFRPPEPYKGTGIKLASETLFRKPGKTKSS
jgi:large subunit ribosomal protein L6